MRNTWRPDEPRVFQLINSESFWVSQLEEALQRGENVALPCTSSTFMGKLQAHLVQSGILEASEILLYDSKTDDSLKRQVQHVNELWVRYRLVMWSPAIEVGVNFDVKGHFDSMFLYICAGANLPFGVMQMQGRARHLKHLTVPIMCSHLSLVSRGSPHWTPTDAAAYFRWADDLSSQLPEQMCAQLNFAEERLDSGDIALLHVHDTVLVVAAHNYSRLMNARCHFMQEWFELVEHAGHKYKVSDNWVWSRRDVGDHTAYLPEYSRDSVLLAAQVIDREQADQFLMLQLTGQATRAQKEALARYFYCRAWGISNAALDEGFLGQHPAHDEGATALSILYSTLASPSAAHKKGPRFCEDPAALAQPAEHKGRILAELLQAMGIRNVLGSAQNNCVISPEVHGALKLCKAFSSPDNVQQTENLFGLHNSRCGCDTSGYLTHRLQVLFEAVGLGVAVTRGRRRQVDKVQHVPYTLDFNAERTHAMAELFKVRYQGVQVWADPQMNEFLSQLEIRLAAKYLEQLPPNKAATEDADNLL